MASLRIIRRRLRSVQGTKQIMRAMQLVSGSKLKRAQGRLMQARMVVEFLDGLMARVLSAAPQVEHPLCAQREGGESALVLVTSDAGLCGSYNTNLIQLAESFLKRDSLRTTQMFYIGKKGYRYFTKRGYPSAEAFLGLAGRPDPAQAERIGRSLMERFLAHQVSAVQVMYSQFMSLMVYRPTMATWLPIQLTASAEPPRPAWQLASRGGLVHRAAPGAEQYIFEPSPQRVFEELLPRWALAKFQCMMLEAFTSEHSARMIAMKNATDNAEEMLKTLTRQRNKIRQSSITKEISEIVGTAEALK